MPKALEYDYIIVGGGASGCALASRLAARGPKVLLLEAGGSDASPLLSIPGAVAYISSAKPFNWSYTTEPQTELGGRSLYLSQGKVLGGGSSINGMVYTRGMPEDYARWRAAGCEGWSYEDVLPYFRRSEHNERGASALHGGAGPLAVSRGRSSLPISDLILEAASQAGFSSVDDFARPDADGFGYYDFTISRGRRVSASTAYLHAPAPAARPDVVTEARVRRVVIEQSRATGVEFERRGVVETAHAAREVVLCAGGVNTPQLLMLSGVGPADHLRSHGVSVVLDQPAVGANFQNHLVFKLAYATNVPITAYRFLGPVDGLGLLMRYAAGRRGFLGDGPSPVGGFFRSEPSRPRPDLQVFGIPAMAGLRGKGLRAALPSAHGFSLFVSQGRPASRGEIRLASGDPRAAPRIDPRYFSDPADLEQLARGVERMRDLAAQPALAKVVTRETVPGPDVVGPTALREAIRRLATGQHHPSGACRMGLASDGAVVDPELRVHGIAGLRVADASIMPELLTGNTNAPVMMIAERAADFILGSP